MFVVVPARLTVIECSRTTITRLKALFDFPNLLIYINFKLLILSIQELLSLTKINFFLQKNETYLKMNRIQY